MASSFTRTSGQGAYILGCRSKRVLVPGQQVGETEFVCLRRGRAVCVCVMPSAGRCEVSAGECLHKDNAHGAPPIIQRPCVTVAWSLVVCASVCTTRTSKADQLFSCAMDCQGLRAGVWSLHTALVGPSQSRRRPPHAVCFYTLKRWRSELRHSKPQIARNNMCAQGRVSAKLRSSGARNSTRRPMLEVPNRSGTSNIGPLGETPANEPDARRTPSLERSPTCEFQVHRVFPTSFF